jgi:hypothetical protein
MAYVKDIYRLFKGRSKTYASSIDRCHGDDAREEPLMGSISITFSGSTMEEVAGLVAAWTPPAPPGPASTRAEATPLSAEANAAAVRRVVSRVRGAQSLQLLRLLAEAGMKGENVTLSDALLQQFDATSGSAFGGMVGPINRVAAAIIGRPLIGYPNGKVGTWGIAPEDATAVLEALDAQ